VSATSKTGDDYYKVSGGKKAVISYFSRDPACRVSFGETWWELAPPDGVYDPTVWDSVQRRGRSTYVDSWIAFDAGTLSPG